MDGIQEQMADARLDHAEAIAEMAINRLDEIARFRTETGEPLNMRIGINTEQWLLG